MCLEWRGEKVRGGGVIFKATGLDELPNATWVWNGSDLRALSPDVFLHGELGCMKKDQQE